MALLGDVKIDCSNLTDQQKKDIQEIPGILKVALTNQEYLKEIKLRLDQLSYGSSVVVQSVGQQGGITAQTVNVTGSAIPNFAGIEKVDKDGNGHDLPDKDESGYPITYARFYADSSWDAPEIAAICDRPCMSSKAGFFTYNIEFSGSFNTYTFTNPNVAGFELTGVLHPMLANTYYLVSVVSKDDKPVTITAIVPYLGKLPVH